MKITRKEFLKLTAGAVAGSAGGFSMLTGCARENKIEYDEIVSSYCPFCSAACGIKLFYKNNKIVSISGDSENPVSQGFICHRGFALKEIITSKDRLTKVKYRKPFSEKWEEISYEEAFKKSAELIVKTREKTFLKQDLGIDVNRTESIGAIAGNNLTNEELFNFRKLTLAFGIVNTGAEIYFSNSNKYSALRKSLGIASYPNPIYDLKNSKLIIMLGADPGDDSPIFTKYIAEAKENGAIVYNVDPVLNKTSVLSTKNISINAGTDLALLNAVIFYLLKNNFYNKEYLKKYTDASYQLSNEFNFNQFFKVFSGFDKNSKSYSDKRSWNYLYDRRGNPKFQNNLKSMNTVLKNLQESFSDYSPGFIRDTCGIGIDDYINFAENIVNVIRSEEPISIICGAGVEKQYQSEKIYHASLILLMLSGSIGKIGGGIFSIDKTGNVQSQQDFIPSWDELPGNLPLPKNNELRKDSSYSVYVRNNTPVSNDPESYNYFKNYEKYSASFLRSIYGKEVLPEKSFTYLPKIRNKITNSKFISSISDGTFEGLLLFNSAIGFSNYDNSVINNSLRKMKWVISSDQFFDASKNIWGNNSKLSPTEVILFPSLFSAEKEGSVTDISRNIKYQMSKNNKNIKDHNEIFSQILKFSKNIVSEKSIYPDPIHKINIETIPENVLRTISGISASKDVYSSKDLNIGESSCGNHYYTGIFSNVKGENVNLSKRNNNKSSSKKMTLYNGFGFTWPQNSIYLFHTDKDLINLTPDKNDLSKDHNPEGKDSASQKPFIYKRNGAASMIFSDSEDVPFPVFYNEFLLEKNFPIDPVADYSKIKSDGYVIIMRNSSDLILSKYSRYFKQINGGALMLTPNENLLVFDAMLINQYYDPQIVNKKIVILNSVFLESFTNVIRGEKVVNSKHYYSDFEKII